MEIKRTAGYGMQGELAGGRPSPYIGENDINGDDEESVEKNELESL
jgi:hypothetical protein